jgi:hypothetical protein
MPYLSVDQNRYLGEHSCARFHFGDQTMIRDCCVKDAQNRKAMMLRCALGWSHPAARLFQNAFNALTEAEQAIVGAVFCDQDYNWRDKQIREMLDVES